MNRWSYATIVLMLAVFVDPASVLAQRGGQGRGQRPPTPEVIRPADQRVPAPYSYDMVRPVALADNVWMSELTILEMRDLVRTYGYTTALVLNGTMESNGPYLTTGKHNHVLRVTGEAIARTLGNTLVAPIRPRRGSQLNRFSFAQGNIIRGDVNRCNGLRGGI